ncbi:DUF202 domain-containing protein [Saccharothrix yanglingensis]|uniref:DUF202 domain-containing protein n=1 Tax=Saccharothrix yanglingensis TaxID=659496 RepID=A0ABU0X126_9PSEU|nr:DUF202 domain-containing protein [Saccharothrix yanglingensis]MDQ2584984.1 hypothetical protein [Saccharothrix yanglingensis]
MAPRDPGLQPERTALAWRRTGLSLVVGSLVVVRLVDAPVGPWLGGVGLAVTGALWIAGERRGRVLCDRAAHPGAALLLATAALVAVVALLGVAWVLARAS